MKWKPGSDLVNLNYFLKVFYLFILWQNTPKEAFCNKIHIVKYYLMGVFHKKFKGHCRRRSRRGKIYVKSPVFFFTCELMHQNAFSLSFLTRDGIPIQTQKMLFFHTTMTGKSAWTICLSNRYLSWDQRIWNNLQCIIFFNLANLILKWSRAV